MTACDNDHRIMLHMLVNEAQRFHALNPSSGRASYHPSLSLPACSDADCQCDVVSTASSAASEASTSASISSSAAAAEPRAVRFKALGYGTYQSPSVLESHDLVHEFSAPAARAAATDSTTSADGTGGDGGASGNRSVNIVPSRSRTSVVWTRMSRLPVFAAMDSVDGEEAFLAGINPKMDQAPSVMRDSSAYGEVISSGTIGSSSSKSMLSPKQRLMAAASAASAASLMGTLSDASPKAPAAKTSKFRFKAGGKND